MTLTGEDTALIVADATNEGSSDEQAAGSKGKSMTDAERADALKKVNKEAKAHDVALFKGTETVVKEGILFGRALLLVQMYDLWKSPKVKDAARGGRLVRQFGSYAKWYEGQNFKTSKSRGAQCVTEAIKAFEAKEAIDRDEFLANLGVGSTADVVTFIASRQKGSTGRPVTLRARAQQALNAVEAYNTKLFDLRFDKDGETELDEEFSEALDALRVTIPGDLRRTLMDWAELDEADEVEDDDAEATEATVA